MTEVDRLRLQVRLLAKRLDILEAQRRPRAPRPPAPRPTDSIVAARERLWSRYVLLHVGRRGRLTKLAFCMRYRLNPSEFTRWLSRSDRRGIPAGSGPDLRFYNVLTDAIGELERHQLVSPSVGRVTGTQFSAARTQ